jgi:hypothetical protein
VANDLIKHSSQPVATDETRWLGWEGVAIIASRRINIKIVTLGSHAFNYVPTSRVVHIGRLAPLVEAIGFILANSHFCGLVWRTAWQVNRRQQGHCKFEVLHRSAGRLLI